MKDNKSAFNSIEYDEKITQTLPYYEDFHCQVIDLVKTMDHSEINWLDKTTPRLIQFHTLKNAVNPPFLGGFSIFNTVVA